MQKSFTTLVAVAVLASGCAGTGYQGAPGTNKAIYGTGIGAAAGAGLGALIAKDKGKGALIGAAVGSVLGAGVGYYLDRQAAQLQQSLAGTGMEVQRQPDSIKVVVPSSVSFATDSAELLQSASQALASIASVANQDPSSTLTVVGHTDSRGTDAHNLTLSQARANSVAQFLQSQGIAGNRLTTQGMGSSQPIASNETETGRAQNRRVEITLHPGNQAGQQAPMNAPQTAPLPQNNGGYPPQY